MHNYLNIEKDYLYLLEMFMYTSGNVHMGHIRVFSAMDFIYLFNLYKGKNVFRPVGWDAFGLPAEIASIKNNISPKIWTLNNIKDMTSTLKKYNFQQNWDTEINTSDQEYYKYDQYIFYELYNNNLIYKDNKIMNFCIDCGVLSNEQSKNDICWRCDKIVEKRETSQWMIKITKYAKELFFSLQELENWPKKIINMQANWIAKCYVNFYIKELKQYIYTSFFIETLSIDTNKKTLTLIYKDIERIVKVSKTEILDIVTNNIEKEDIFELNLNDWCISRQRYWGTPIPVIHCDNCGTFVSNQYEKFKLENPIEIECDKCLNIAKRENDTMDTFMSSSWYMWRFLDNKNKKIFPNINKSVDLYIGGAEHAVMHLLYSRFLTRFFFDIGLLNIKEPFNRLVNQGMVLNRSYFCVKCNKYFSEEEIQKDICYFCKELVISKIEKMSKSKKNGLSAESLLKKYSADTIKMYILSKSALTDDICWNKKDIIGIERFIDSVSNWLESLIFVDENIPLENINKMIIELNLQIEKIIQSKYMKFNVAVTLLIGLFKNIKKQIIWNKKQPELLSLLKLLSLFIFDISNLFCIKFFNKDIRVL